jgi:hypothetical protein
MTENSEAATPAAATPITTPPKADDQSTDATDNGSFWRPVLLFLFLVLASVWIYLQFGVKPGSIPVVALILSIVAGCRKQLRGPDGKAVDRFIDWAYSIVRKTPVLVVLYVVLAAVTLTHSTIVVSDAKAKAACIHPAGDTKCTHALVSGDNEARFFVWTTGKSYRARLGDSDEMPVPLWPWRVPRLDKDSFRYSPSILVRVPYPHADIVDGQIQIRDATTKTVVASATTTNNSASLLVGRDIKAVSAAKDWDDELTAAGAKEPWAQRARDRWRNCLRLQTPVKLVDAAQLEGVFRTQKQLSSGNPDDVAASALITVNGGEAMQDVKLERRKHE